MNAADLIDKRVLVAGLGVTGRSVARWLASVGVRFEVMDAKASPHGLPSDCVIHADLDAALAPSPAGPVEVIVLSPGIPRSSAAIGGALSRGCRVIGDIELFAGAIEANGSPVIAVTGSNGKSTVVAWLSEALVAVGVRAVACGNIGEAALDALHETVQVYVLELSSYQLESTESLAPLAACVLNVSDDHLDRYDSFAHYAATKRRVYDGALHRLVNAQDEHTLPTGKLAANDACIDVADASRSPLGDAAGVAPGDAVGVAPGDAPSDPAAGTPTRWHLDHGDVGSLCRDGRPLLAAGALALPGRHNAVNALAVLALASVTLSRLRGSSALPAELLEAVAGFTGLPHRTERVALIDGVSWFDDSKGTNVDACVRAIQAMPGPVVLIAGGQGKGADFTPIARQAPALKAAVLIGQDAPLMAAVLGPVTPVHLADTLEGAVEQAVRLSRPGDAVLLSPACASFDMFSDFTARGRAFQRAVRALDPSAGPMRSAREQAGLAATSPNSSAGAVR